MGINIYIHKTCPTSVRLLELLEKNNLLEKVNVIDVGVAPFKLLNRGVVSVPYIEKNGELIDMGPINFDAVISFIREHSKRKVEELDFEGILTKLINLVKDNVFYSINVFLRESLSFLLDSKPIIEYLNLNGKEHDFKKWLIEREKEIIGDHIGGVKKTIVRNFLFEVKLLKGKRITLDEFKNLYNVQHIAHWLLFRGSVGRVSLVDVEKVKVMEKAKEIYNDIISKLSG